MILSIISVIAMGVMFVYMINKAKFARTRRMAFLPMACCGMEILATGILHPASFPLLTILLVSLRLVILGCCIGAMHQDAIMVRRRETNRMRSARMVRDNVTAFPVPPRELPRRRNTCA